MTLSRDTIEAALTAVNHQRAERRRSLRAAESAQVTAHLEAELTRLDVAHAELAVELELVKAPAPTMAAITELAAAWRAAADRKLVIVVADAAADRVTAEFADAVASGRLTVRRSPILAADEAYIIDPATLDAALANTLKETGL